MRLAAALAVALAVGGCTADQALDTLHAGGKLIYDTLKAASERRDHDH